MLWDLNKRSYDYIHMVKQVKIKQMNCTSLSLSLCEADAVFSDCLFRIEESLS